MTAIRAVAVLGLLFAVSLAGVSYAEQRGWFRQPQLASANDHDGAFHYCRVMYRSNRFGDGGGWGEGRVTLLGDAAHPLTTILAQGACQAVEDTVVLADSLSQAPDPQTGLRRYEAERQARSSHVMALSTAANSTAAQEKPVPAWLRRQVLKVILPRKVRKDLDEMLVTGP